MPEFPHFEEQIMRNALLGLPLDEIAYDGAKLGQAEGALMSMGRQAGFTVLNTRKLFCGNAEGPCSAFESGRPLLIDYGHLSLLGAQTIGKRAVGDPAWQRWLRTALQSLMSAPDATGALRR
jgi:hypothetical protein